MKNLSNHRSYLLLLSSILAGGIIGLYFPNISNHLKPLGEIYMNFIYVSIVPTVFLGIVSSVISNENISVLKKVFSYSFLVFLIFTLAAVLLALLLSLLLNPAHGMDINHLTLEASNLTAAHPLSISDTMINMLSVDNFLVLFTKENLLPLIIFSFVFGFSIHKTGEKANPIKKIILSCNSVFTSFITIIMKASPIGLGCYFSYSISKLGGEIAKGFIAALFVYIFFTLLYFFVFYSIYMYYAGGRNGVITYWKNIIPPSLNAIATASGTACIPVNIKTAQKNGVHKEIAEAVIPIGINLHKDGAAGACVIQLIFLFTIYDVKPFNLSALMLILLISILASIVMGSVPGGGMSSAILMASFFAFPEEAVSIIIIMSTLFDIPATLLNSVGNIPAASVVNRLLVTQKSNH